MIEKELFIKSKDDDKIAIFHIRAENIDEYFKQAEQIKDKLNNITKEKFNEDYGFDIDYEAIYGLRKMSMKENINDYSHMK